MFSGLKVREPERLSSSERQFIHEALDLIANHLSEKDFNVTKLCLLLEASRVTVHRRLKSATGQSASQFIRSIKLHHAAALMRSELLPVGQAARMSGFYNLSYFTRCFREEFGMCPSEYMKLKINKKKSQP